jgi:hypothetical protein
MNLQKFNELIVKVHDHITLTQAEKTYIKDDLPLILVDIPTIHTIREYTHPVCTRLTGAPPRSYLKAYSLILGKKAFGTREMIGHPFFDEIEKELTIGIMRSNFEYDRPKGYYCCKICSMAIFPLLEMDLLHKLSGKEIAYAVRPRIEARDPQFTKGVPEKLIEFTLSF